MRILILGGTVFLGRHLVAAALRRGHTVTTFNRGSRPAPAEQAAVEKLHGDRNIDLGALHGRSWDAVIDTSCYTQEQAMKAVDLLGNAVDSYCFVSSVFVYKSTPQSGTAETAEILSSDSIQDEQNANTYGAQKSDCEKFLQQAIPSKLLIIRPGLIVGPYDPTDRFTYWAVRVSRGGTVLAPGRPSRQIQFIDARDLAEWMIQMSERKALGIYNATGPDYELTMEAFLNTCRSSTESTARFAWVADELLVKSGARPWTELPLWIPESELSSRGFLSIDSRKAQKAGLRHRDIAETIKDTLEWDRTRPSDEVRKAGLSRTRELELVLQCLPDENVRQMKEALQSSPGSPLHNIAAQLEQLREEAALLKQVSVQLEGMASSISNSSSAMDELLAILKQMEAASDDKSDK